MINYKFTILTVCILLSVSGCLFRESTDTIVSDKTILLSEKGIEIQCDPPLSRTHNSASIMLVIKEEWSPTPPWKEIILQNGDKVTINISLNSVNGIKYSANIIGGSNGDINGRFEPEIPKGIEIVSVVVSASSNLTCKRMFWHNFDPL